MRELSLDMIKSAWRSSTVRVETNSAPRLTTLTRPSPSATDLPPKLAGRAIGLAGFVSEIVGGTIAPTISGDAADRFGLAAPLWIAGAGVAGVLCRAR